jgi:hypothetical protein
VGSLKDKLFQDYALTLQKMVRKSNQVQLELLKVINNIFIYDLDPKTDKKLIRVSPELTEDKLQTLVENTRKIIIDYYVSCETDFTTGVKLYEAIVETQIRITTESQIRSMEETKREMIHSIVTHATPIQSA